MPSLTNRIRTCRTVAGKAPFVSIHVPAQNAKREVIAKVSQEDYQRLAQRFDGGQVRWIGKQLAVESHSGRAYSLVAAIYRDVIPLHCIRYANGNKTDLRRENVQNTLDNIDPMRTKAPKRPAVTEPDGGYCPRYSANPGHWDISPGSCTVALVSTCIKDKPKASLEELAEHVARVKCVDPEESLCKLREMRQAGLLGYYDRNRVFWKWK